MDPDHPVLNAAIMLGMLGLLAWLELPPWQRHQITSKIRAKVWLTVARLARASGHRAMGDELAGRQTAAHDGYQFTYRLSRLRDRL